MKKKLISVFAALTMALSSIVAVTTAYADNEPSVTATVIEGANTINETELGLKFTFDNLEKDVTKFQFKIEIPTTLKTYEIVKQGKVYVPVIKDIVSSNVDKLLGADEGSIFGSEWNYNVKTIDDSHIQLYFAWLTDGTKKITAADSFELDFGVEDFTSIADLNLPSYTFKLSEVQVVYDGEVSPVTNLKVVDPTTKEPSVEPTTPEYVYNADKPADTKWGAATFVGDYSTADDKAIAVKAEVKPGQKVVDGALVDNTYTGLVWKAVKADGTAVGYEQDGLSITGNGTYVFGLAIDGVSEAEVQTNGFGIAVK